MVVLGGCSAVAQAGQAAFPPLPLLHSEMSGRPGATGSSCRGRLWRAAAALERFPSSSATTTSTCAEVNRQLLCC